MYTWCSRTSICTSEYIPEYVKADVFVASATKSQFSALGHLFHWQAMFNIQLYKWLDLSADYKYVCWHSNIKVEWKLEDQYFSAIYIYMDGGREGPMWGVSGIGNV